MTVFLAGFLVPRDILKREWGKKVSDVLVDEVAKARSHKELLKVLLARHNVNDKEVIGLLEDTVYRGKKVALSSIKKMLEEVEKGKKCKIK
jgi:hypothetical protein